MLFAKQRFGSNFRHAVHTGVDGNAVAPHCAVQQIGIPPLACACWGKWNTFWINASCKCVCVLRQAKAAESPGYWSDVT